MIWNPGVSAIVVGAVYLGAIFLPGSLDQAAKWILVGLMAVGVLSNYVRLELIERRSVRAGITLSVGVITIFVAIALSRLDLGLAWVLAGLAFTLALAWLGADYLLGWAEALSSGNGHPYSDAYYQPVERATPTPPVSRSHSITRRGLRDELDDAAAALGRAAENRLAATYGRDWLTTINTRRAANGLRPYEPGEVRADPRAALSVIGHDPAFEPTVGPVRAKARFLLRVANRLHHPHLDVSDDELRTARAALRHLLDMTSRI